MSHLAMTSLKFSFLERDKGSNNYSESILVTQFLSHDQYKKQVTINAGYLITFIAEKNLSYNISSFNESTGFGLLKASPVEFVRYPFQLLTHASYKSVILLSKQHSLLKLNNYYHTLCQLKCWLSLLLDIYSISTLHLGSVIVCQFFINYSAVFFMRK